MINEHVSVLVPVFRMADSIEANVDKAVERLSAILTNYEIILSNDGSPDDTLKSLERVKEKYSGRAVIKVANSSVNKGKGHALKRAFEQADGELIAFLDADMELDPMQLDDFKRIMDEEAADVVIGSKRHPKSQINYSSIRRFISTIYFLFVKIFFRLPIRDTQTGIKLFKREVLAKIFPRVLVKAFAYDLEVLAAAHRHNYKIAEAPIKLRPVRNFGFIAFRVLWQTFKDTLAIFYRLRIQKFYDNLFPETDYSPMFSIIIPIKSSNDYIRQVARTLRSQNYKNFELIILPDSKDDGFDDAVFNADFVRIIESGDIPPAQKRHLGAEKAKGDWLSFLDDDTYPEVDWLANAVRAIADRGVKALGGPAINAPDDNFWQKISGAVYSSKLVSGNYTYRYREGEVREVLDYPSCNLMVEKDYYFSLGGFDKKYWPGEDTAFCNKIIDNGKRILYSPEVLVYHHRRHIFKGHFKQIANYAWYRGQFIRKGFANSLSPTYFVPSLFMFYFFSLLAAAPAIILAFPEYINYLLIYSAPLALYILMLGISSTIGFELKKAPFKFIGIFLSHIVYGFNFISGLLLLGKRH